MADRSSAALCAKIFDLLAKSPTDENKALAREVWRIADECDFTPDQMDADAALKKLGLAREGVDPDWPGDGPATLYGPEK